MAIACQYTTIVERYVKPPQVPKGSGIDPRSVKLEPTHFEYKFVSNDDYVPWNNIKLILTEFVQGLGHKGEIVEVPRTQAYLHLLPSRRAVYVTEEYLKMYEKDRLEAAKKERVSAVAERTRKHLESMILEIPMNFEHEWTLKPDHIRIALRYNKVVCPNESIEMDLKTQALTNFKAKELYDKVQKQLEEMEETEREEKRKSTDLCDIFKVNIKINSTVTTALKCRIAPVNKIKMLELFTKFHKTA